MWGGISDSPSFTTHGLSYYVCEHCGHINGGFLETEDFTNQCYTSDDIDYGRLYREKDKEAYTNRANSIYIPKVDFLLETLKEDGVNPNDMSYLDVGTGSGYFVYALKQRNMNACGIEVSERQVEFGNYIMSDDTLHTVSQDNVTAYIRDVSTDVISFIGVLEHVVNLDEVLDAINDNENIKYIFFSVPMMSYAVILESVFPDIYNRVLGGTHTHIFTNESLRYLYERYGWDVKGEWRFGADAADLLRAISVKINMDGNRYLSSEFTKRYMGIIDRVQKVFDEDNYCSEIHVVAKIKH